MNTQLSNSRSPFDRIYSDLEQFYDVLWGRTPSDRGREGFVPALNIWEEEDQYIVETELPGVSAKDVEVTLEGRELKIRGERKAQEPEKKKQLHRQERLYGQFQRVVRFPSDVNPDGVDAKSQDGVLRITVKKSEALKPRRIQIS